MTDEEFAAIKTEAAVRRKERGHEYFGEGAPLYIDPLELERLRRKWCPELPPPPPRKEAMTGRQLLEKLSALKPYELDLPVCSEYDGEYTTETSDLIVARDEQGISGPLIIKERGW